MKIAVLSFTSGKYNRGVETVVTELTERWRKKYDVWVADQNRPQGIKLIKKLWKWKPDIVMPMNRGWQAVWVRLFCWIKGAKMVVSGQAGYKDRWSLLTRPDIFVALTNRAAKWAKKYSFGIRVEVIPNGVDLEKFKPSGNKLKFNLERPIILCVAGGERYKRVEETIKAVSFLPKGSLLLVGGSRKQESFGRKILGQRFSRRRFPYYQMPLVYRSVDVFTLVSESSEAFEVDYLEACNFAVRKSVLEEVGGYDLGYKETSEWCEVDLAFRIRKADYKLLFNPKIAVSHHLSRQGVFLKRFSVLSRLQNFCRFYFRQYSPKTLLGIFHFLLFFQFLIIYYLFIWVKGLNLRLNIEVREDLKKESK